jgi:Peptidase inhibitor I78 family
MKMLATLSLFALAACVSAAEELPTEANAKVPDTSAVDPLKPCDVSAVKNAVGKPFTDSLAAELKKKIGANIIRLIPPGAVVTMDYRGDRLNISYDEHKFITDISCG